jgi:hypothetical protein
MHRMARLIVAAIALLGVMTVGALAASPSAIPPRAGDLPAIVTALPTTDSVASTVAQATAASSPSAPSTPESPAASASPSSGGSSSRSGARASTPKRSSASAAPPVTATAATPGSNDLARDSHGGDSHPSDKEHEVVTPPLHESDGHGHSSDSHDSDD